MRIALGSLVVGPRQLTTQFGIYISLGRQPFVVLVALPCFDGRPLSTHSGVRAGYFPALKPTSASGAYAQDRNRPVADIAALAFIPQMADRIAPSEAAARQHVVSSLKRIIQLEAVITEATEPYYDLGLAGEDLADAIDAIREPFGTDFSLMDLRQFAPNEVAHNFGLNLFREFRERRGERTYRSLKVANLVEAVRVGSWKDR